MCLALPGLVLSISERGGTPMGVVDFGGVRRTVCLEYLPEARVDDYVIVHAGFAIQRLDEESARESWAVFEELGILEAEPGAGGPGTGEPLR
ncbi:MAG TPA: HypC/HybG/HupF family hydrogenase formation chaperone [Nocardioidaceae bacterium]|nr:HypC/HybG/HupF family hydrogenase formation chaperone [Nocardioidaceae bacterium]